MDSLNQTVFLIDENHNSLTDEMNNQLFINKEGIIMVNTDKLLLVSIDTITAFNNAKQLEFILDEIQDATISNTQENTDITGKQGRIIGTLKRNKAVNITGNNGFVVGGAMAAQTGSNVEIGSFTVRVSETLTVSSNTATMEGTPVGVTGAEIGVAYKRNPNGSLEDKHTQDATAATTGTFSYSDKTLTFYEGDFEDGDEVVIFYDQQVESAKITNDSNTYSKTLKMYIDVTLSDNCDNMYHGQFYIPRADFTGEFDIAMGTDATAQSFAARSLADTCTGKGTLWDLIVW